MTFKELIDKARPTSLDEILKDHGVNGVKEGASMRYKNEAMNIVVTGGKWYDNKAGIGGAGPIDLVSHLQNCSFKEAVLWIVKSCHPKPSFLPAVNISTNQESKSLRYEDVREQYALRDDSRWPEACSYLVTKRCLTASMINECFQNGDIYATNKGGVAFLHRNIDGEEVGCSIRSIEHSSKFRQSLGKKTEGWFSVGNLKGARTIIIVESAIDALSLATLSSLAPKTAIAAVSGAYSPLPLLEHALQNEANIVSAYDNDLAGLRAKEQLRMTWEKFAIGKEGLSFSEQVPILKDWNEDLCQKLKMQQPHKIKML